MVSAAPSFYNAPSEQPLRFVTHRINEAARYEIAAYARMVAANGAQFPTSFR
jgi:hypothetical protein